MKKYLVLVFVVFLLLTSTHIFAAQGQEAAGKENSGIIPFKEANIDEFKESPVLKDKVEAGELPPVEERLPKEPVVIKPEKEIGNYGGSITFTQFGPETLGVNGHVLVETPLLKNRDLTDIYTVPNFAKDWEYSNDGKTFTLYLREGLKWSDGVELTTDDIMFWYNDVLKNTELTPSIAATFRPGGKLMEVKAIDKHTVEFNFEIPYYNFHTNMDSSWYAGLEFFMPSHYLKQFHIDYNEQADEIAQEEGFDSWIQYFTNRNSWEFGDPKPIGRPLLSAWIPKKVTTSGRIYERNPYYFKVDSEGNQLPYIDEKRTVYTQDPQARLMNILSGEIDFISSFLSFSDYPTIKENEEDGDYNAWIGDSLWSSRVTFSVQQQPVGEKDMWDILGDVRFRQALSLAIDRSEIKDLVFMGQGEERQLTFAPGTFSNIKEEWKNAYIDYNPEKAKELLDEMGIVDQNDDGWREKPNGDQLLVGLLADQPRAVAVSVAEMAKGYWEDIGIQINMNSTASFYEFVWEGDFHIATTFKTGELPPTDQYLPSELTHFAYGNWLLDYDGFSEEFLLDEVPESRADIAIEPPEDIKKWYSWGHKLNHVDESKREELLEKIGDKIAEELPAIGTIGMAGHVGVSKNGLRNIRKVGDNPSIGATRNAYAEQFYWENPDNN